MKSGDFFTAKGTSLRPLGHFPRRSVGVKPLGPRSTGSGSHARL